MTRSILTYGLIAGVIVGAPMIVMGLLGWYGAPSTQSMIVGYAIMIVALTAVFVGVKRYRDREKGGVIKFLPAFLMGLGISAVAGVIYVIAWEITMQIMPGNFIETYAAAHLAEQEAAGATAAELEALRAQMAAMVESYANPLFRWPITFVEIFPLGVLVSLITALLLRNDRFMPAR